MIVFPCAKINLGLNVVEKRPDGYHNLETVFYPIPLTDALEVTPMDDKYPLESGYDLKMNGPEAMECRDEDNLVAKALRKIAENYSVPRLHIHLYKGIPSQAGLGGGSSDAAHTLLMLNKLFELGISDDDLAAMAATLGADCAFFIYNRPMMATGIGDVLSPVAVELKGKTLLLVKPPVGVDTRTAYSRIVPTPSTVDLSHTIAQRVEMWDGVLVNDFEPSVFAALPQLWLIKAQLLDAGAQYAAMSGSGSTIFGIFNSDKLAEAAADTFADCATFVLQL